ARSDKQRTRGGLTSGASSARLTRIETSVTGSPGKMIVFKNSWNIGATMATQPKSVERIFERLVDAAPDSIAAIEANGTIQLANRQVEELFGYTRERLIGAPVEMLMPERFRALHSSRRVLWAQQPASRTLGEGLDLTGLRSDGTEFAVEIRVSPFEAEAGLFAVGIVRDATHGRRDKDQRLKLVRDLG